MAEDRGTVLFVNGRLGAGFLWMPLVEDLRRHFRCLIVDSGEGGQPELIARIERTMHGLGERRCAWVAHDTGAACVWELSERGWDRDVAVALINPCVQPAPLMHRRRWLSRYWLSRLAWCGPTLPDAYHDWLMSAAAETAWRTWASSPEVPPRVRQLRGQVLLLWGAQDPLNALSDAPALIEAMGDVDFFEHPECGHFPCEEQTPWVVDKLRTFLFRAFAGSAGGKKAGVFGSQLR